MKRALILALLALATPAWAASQTEAAAALAAARSAEAEAGRLGNRWVPTEAALKAAQTALDAKNWDQAASAAAEAQALALRSVEQSHEQETAWHDAVIR
jgi:hypothetical protein